MSAPSTRNMGDDEIRELRALRRSQNCDVRIIGMTTFVMLREGQEAFRMFTAVCGSADSFDPEAGEYLARSRMQDYIDGHTVDGTPVCAEMASMLDFI